MQPVDPDLHFSDLRAAGVRERLRLGVCGRILCPPGWSMPRRFWEHLSDFDLWYVWAGRGRMRTRDGEVDLRPGVCFWMRPGGVYAATQRPGTRLGVNFIHFQIAPRRGRRAEAWRFPEILYPSNLDFVDAAMRRIIELSDRNREVAEDLLAALLRVLLWEEQVAAVPPDAGAVSRPQRQVIEQIAAEMRQRPGDASVAALARRAGYGADHFGRLFRAVMGVSPKNYVIEVRLRNARQLLAESHLKIEAVAAQLGYRNVYFFSRQFTQKTGWTPSAFRRLAESGGVPAARIPDPRVP